MTWGRILSYPNRTPPIRTYVDRDATVPGNGDSPEDWARHALGDVSLAPALEDIDFALAFVVPIDGGTDIGMRLGCYRIQARWEDPVLEDVWIYRHGGWMSSPVGSRPTTDVVTALRHEERWRTGQTMDVEEYMRRKPAIPTLTGVEDVVQSAST